MFKRLILSVSLVIVALHAAFAAESSDKLMQYIATPQTKHVTVVSHRGDWRNAPENSLQAFQNAIDMGVDMIEIDLNMTKDSVLIVMHDRTLNRTTNGKGPANEKTLAEIKALTLKSGHGCPTTHRVPTLQEVLELAKGKVLINIDKGYEYFHQVYKLLESTGTTKQVVIKSSKPYEQVIAENREIIDKVVYMPVVNLNSPNAEEIINGYKAMQPNAIECCFKEYTPEVERLLRLVEANGSKIWVNTLWASLCAGHEDDRAVEQGQADQSWGWVLNEGATILQTDRPVQLIKYLKKHHRH